MKKFVEFIKPAAILLVVAAIAALILGGVNLATKGRIAAIAEEKMTTAMQTVLPAEGYTDVGYAPDGEIEAVYQAENQGWVVQVTETGSQGTVTMMVGVDGSYACTGISITDSSETAGLGAIASQQSEKGEAFRNQFVGLSGTVAVTKEGGAVDAISGATITSRAVCRGVTAALNVCADLSGGVPAATPAPVSAEPAAASMG